MIQIQDIILPFCRRDVQVFIQSSTTKRHAEIIQVQLNAMEVSACYLHTRQRIKPSSI